MKCVRICSKTFTNKEIEEKVGCVGLISQDVMSFFKQAKEDVGAFCELLYGGAKDRFEFEGKTGPVIAIHGVWGVWTKNGLREYMIRKDVKGVLVNFGYLERGVDNYLNLLNDEVEKFPNALLLGFSAGGFVALRFAQKYGWDKFKKIITVATPFQGTYYARLLRNKGLTFREMIPGSEFLKNLSTLTPPGNKVLSVFAFEDMHTNFGNINLSWPIAVVGAKSHGEIQNNSNYLEDVLDSELEIS